jgi:hypothetical protein
MPMHVVRFGSTDDVPVAFNVTLVPTVETDAIVIIPPDKDPTSVAEVGGNTQGTLYISFNQGSLTSLNIRLYDSYKGLPASAADWYQEVIESDANGTATLFPMVITLTASAQVAWHFPIGAAQAMKVTVQGTGSNAGATLGLHIALRSN